MQGNTREEERLAEDEIARRKLEPRGVLGDKDFAKMTPRIIDAAIAMTSTAEEKVFLKVAVAAIPRVAEIVWGFPPDIWGIFGAHCRSVTWPRQSGISGPRSTAFTELRGGASFCSTAAAGSSAGDLSGSTEGGAGDILSNSTAAAAGCASFGSTVGGLADSTVVSGAGDVLFGSTAVPAGCASFTSTSGALSGSTEEEGAGDIVFGSTAGAAGRASFGSTAAAGSSAGVFVSCGGRDRGSGGDDTIRWRRAPDPVTWWNQVITLRAILKSDGRALGGVGGCCPCAGADAAANNCRDRKNIAAPNTLDLMVLPPTPLDNERNVRAARSSSCSHTSFPAPAGWSSQHR